MTRRDQSKPIKKGEKGPKKISIAELRKEKQVKGKKQQASKGAKPKPQKK